MTDFHQVPIAKYQPFATETDYTIWKAINKQRKYPVTW